MAFISEYLRGGKKVYVIVWLDASKGLGKKGRKTVFCKSHGATNAAERNILLKKYQSKEDKIKKDVEVFGANLRKNDISISEAINNYLTARKNEVEIRKKRGGKEGLAKNSYLLNVSSLKFFSDFCKKKKIQRCKEITPKTLQVFRNWIQLLKGINVEKMSTSYLNQILRNVKTFINSFKIERPPVFEDIPALTATLKAFPNNLDLPFHFEVKELQAILKAAMRFDNELCKISREKHDAGKNFNGDLPLKNVSLFPTIVLTMLTGARKGEVLGLKWKDVDLSSGIIKIRAQKTDRARLLPLIDNIYKVVSPSLLELLRLWKLKTQDEFVLPHPLSDKPTELQHPLDRFRKEIKIPELTFQNLRKNFCSYVVSAGVNPTIAAFWIGHSPAVAERFYLSYAIGAQQGSTIEESMGISEILKEAIAGYKGTGNFQNLQLVKWA